MKANKVKECKECLSWQNCQYSIWPEGRIPLACPLPDWPEVGMEEIEKMIMMRWGISEKANGNKKWLLDILKSINVIIKE